MVQNKEGTKGQLWFLEDDLRAGTSIKADKTGKATLTLLRHMGRLHDLRISVEGVTQVVHVLLQ